MIATCQPTATEWSAGTLPSERTGSLRRIDDIVSELLTRYPHAVETATAQTRGIGPPPIDSTADAMPEMMLVGQR